MRFTVDTALVEAAEALRPVIRKHAEEAERERRLSRPVVEALAGAGLLRLYVPQSLGGLETDPVTAARVTEVLSGFDSVVGWAMMSANGMSWWCARLPDDGAEEVYAETPDVFMTTAYHPLMHATPTDGGYRVSGRSNLASNCHEARWLALFAQVMDGDDQPRMIDGAPEFIGAVVRAEECEILDTWYVTGMRGTDSNDLAAHDVFVPARRTFFMVPEFRPGRHYGGPLYRMPALGADGAPWMPVALATARAAIDEVCALAERKTPMVSTTPLRQRASAQGKVGLAEATLESARVLLYDRLREAWGRAVAGEDSTLRQKAELYLACVHAVQSAARVVELMYGVAGSSAIYSGRRLERLSRDMQVLRQHGGFSESRYETVGQVLLGLPPDLELVAF